MPSVKKSQRGLSAAQRRALELDTFEAEDGPSERRVLEEGGADLLELPEDFEDEEIDSDDEDVDEVLVGRRRKAADDESEDEQSIGSSVDPEELTDLSAMLDDDGEHYADGDSDDGDFGGGGDDDDDDDDDASADDAADAPGSNASMLKAVGLSGPSGGAAARRRREKTEVWDEGEFAGGGAGGGAGGLSVDALLRPLEEKEGFGRLRRNLATLTKPARARAAAARARVEAPLERSDQRRLERRAATAAAHRELDRWEGAVQEHKDAESMSYPAERPAGFGSSAGAIAALPSRTEMEVGVDALLKEHALEPGKAAAAEQLEMAALSAEEVAKRTAELRKMRDLLFYHEAKAKRVAKIKSKTFRKVHKRAKAARLAQQEQLGQLDRKTAQKLALQKEVDRVRERMTLKHKNSSRWVRRALKHQQHNPALQSAVAEQLAIGEELRKKQLDANAGDGGDSDDDDESDDDDSDGGDGEGGEGEEGYDAFGALGRVKGEAAPQLPDKGVLAMDFMKRGVERRRREAEAVMRDLEESLRAREEGEGEGGDSDDEGGDDDDDDDEEEEEGEDGVRKTRSSKRQPEPAAPPARREAGSGVRLRVGGGKAAAAAAPAAKPDRKRAAAADGDGRPRPTAMEGPVSIDSADLFDAPRRRRRRPRAAPRHFEASGGGGGRRCRR